MRCSSGDGGNVSQTTSVDELFRAAVAAIDTGDVAALDGLLREHPELVRLRLEEPGSWLREKIGNAADGFFARPYLLWFVAEDPVRTGQLPPNIADLAKLIIDAAQREQVESLQEQLDYAVNLVAWSWIADQHDVQIPLIDVLADAGVHGAPQNALVNGHARAAAHLVERGAHLALPTAVCLGRFAEAERAFAESNDAQKQLALVLAALNGRADALGWLIERGVDLNQPSQELYSHASPLHHAVCSGNLEAVRVLAEAGADLTATDTLWSGTPLGWAEYYVEQNSGGERAKAYETIAEYLREKGRRS
jgi:peptide-methionine (S)-S-oxide reductase